MVTWTYRDGSYSAWPFSLRDLPSRHTADDPIHFPKAVAAPPLVLLRRRDIIHKCEIGLLLRVVVDGLIVYGGWEKTCRCSLREGNHIPVLFQPDWLNKDYCHDSHTRSWSLHVQEESIIRETAHGGRWTWPFITGGFTWRTASGYLLNCRQGYITVLPSYRDEKPRAWSYLSKKQFPVTQVLNKVRLSQGNVMTIHVRYAVKTCALQCRCHVIRGICFMRHAYRCGY